MSLVTTAGATLAFLERHAPSAPSRVLVAGAEDPEVAAALAARGHDVTVVDETIEPCEAPGADRVRWVTSAFLYHDDPEPYDVAVFAWTLHRLAPVGRALDKARSLLAPDGLLLAEDVAFDRVNVHTARWLYDLESVLVAAGALRPPDPRDAAEGRPLLRWRQEHAAEPPLVTGHDLLAAARERFALEAVEEAPYLFRYLAPRIVPGPHAPGLLSAIHEIESRLVRERDLAAAGLRIAARRSG
ncbi:MAG: class I SAM-dependent methyltransferase [Hyphomicrobiales bacterium]